MSASRDQMVAVLKEVVVPNLRAAGFRGSFPHLRRHLPDQLDLLTFQFSQFGGQFAVEIAYCPPDGYTEREGEFVRPSAARVHDLNPDSRLRLGVRPPPNNRDHWFRFEIDRPEEHLETATAVLALLESQAESWWRTHQHVEPWGA